MEEALSHRSHQVQHGAGTMRPLGRAASAVGATTTAIGANAAVDEVLSRSEVWGFEPFVPREV